jgi:hypothetical protein
MSKGNNLPNENNNNNNNNNNTEKALGPKRKEIPGS